MKKIAIAITTIALVGLIILGSFWLYNNYFSKPQEVKINSLKITNIYRDCTKNHDGNYRDITVQTTLNIDVDKTAKYSLKILPDECTLKIGPNSIPGFYLGKIPTDPNIQGIDESGLYMVVGGNLRGDVSDTLTFCCQGKCDVGNLEICK